MAEARRPPHPGSETSKEQARGAVEGERRARDEQVRAEADQAGGGAREHASRATRGAREWLRDYLEERKSAVAQRVGGFADAFSAAADDLDRRHDEQAAGAARQMAGGLECASTAISDHTMEEIADSLDAFARRNPALLVGGAMLAGFAATRFLCSSGSDDHRSSDQEVVDGER